MKKVIVFIACSIAFSLNCFSQSYTADDLKNAARALTNNDEWYIDQIKDADLRNATKAQLRNDEWYIDQIKDE